MPDRTETATSAEGVDAKPSRRYFELALGFVCVFAGLALPSPGLGPMHARAHTAIANALVPSGPLASGVTLHFSATPEQLEEAPFRTTLVVTPPAPAKPVFMPIDLRSLMYLPCAAFAGLALATPLASPRKNLKLLGWGLLWLELLLLLLNALPLVSFLGGTGPVQAFYLPTWLHALLQVPYRALVAPPGMAYAIPLLLWWLLVSRRDAIWPRARARVWRALGRRLGRAEQPR